MYLFDCELLYIYKLLLNKIDDTNMDIEDAPRIAHWIVKDSLVFRFLNALYINNGKKFCSTANLKLPYHKSFFY